MCTDVVAKTNDILKRVKVLYGDIEEEHKKEEEHKEEEHNEEEEEE